MLDQKEKDDVSQYLRPRVANFVKWWIHSIKLTMKDYVTLQQKNLHIYIQKRFY